MQREPAGAGDLVTPGAGAAGGRERHRHHAFVRPPPPARRRLPVLALDLLLRVVAPPHDRGQRVGVAGHEEAQPHRRREEPLPGRLPLLRRLLRQAARLQRLVDVVVLVPVRPHLGLRAGRNEEARQIPVRRAHPAGQSLFGEGVARPRTDEVEVQRLDEAFAHLRRVGDGAGAFFPRHVIDSASRRPCGRARNPPGRRREC